MKLLPVGSWIFWCRPAEIQTSTVHHAVNNDISLAAVYDPLVTRTNMPWKVQQLILSLLVLIQSLNYLNHFINITQHIIIRMFV